MKYKLKIVNATNAERSVTEVNAKGAFRGKTLVLDYVFDGAPYRLEICGDAVKHTRRGLIKLEMNFIAGKTTQVIVADGGADFQFDIFTERLEVAFDGDNCDMDCEFSGVEPEGTTVLQVRARAVNDNDFS